MSRLVLIAAFVVGCGNEGMKVPDKKEPSIPDFLECNDLSPKPIGKLLTQDTFTDNDIACLEKLVQQHQDNKEK